jgi:ribulose-phosphate 3-epimerase
MKPFIIAPSILSADLARLGEEVESVLKAGADWIHFDVMDNHYVPNLSFGPMICQALRNYGIKAPIDVHLMVEPVDDLIHTFSKAGATSISFHLEASKHIDRSLSLIREQGIAAGLAFNPATPLYLLEEVAEKLDMILLMSVNPGFAGQSFIPSVLKKAEFVRKWIDDNKLNIRLEMDGGINLENLQRVRDAGVDTFVAGSAIFGKDKDYVKTIQKFRDLLKANDF